MRNYHAYGFEVKAETEIISQSKKDQLKCSCLFPTIWSNRPGGRVYRSLVFRLRPISRDFQTFFLSVVIQVGLPASAVILLSVY
jgi:hypothetical protein